jgi:hypothetical protein
MRAIREFIPRDNGLCMGASRPIGEAFAHARYLLQMACKHDKELGSAPNVIPSGWPAVLYLYHLR